MAAAEALKMDQTTYSSHAAAAALAGPFIFHPLTMPAQLILAINARNLLPSAETVLLQELLPLLLLLFNYASPEIATVGVGGWMEVRVDGRQPARDREFVVIRTAFFSSLSPLGC